MNITRSIDYDSLEEPGEESLFAIWESGRPSKIPAPLSVRRPRYRQFIVGLVKRHSLRSSGRVLSIGAGNGFTEAEFSDAGFDILATDRSKIALEYCKKKGLRTALYDFPKGETPAELKEFDVIYCDGVLGQLWGQEVGYQECWSRFAEFGKPPAILLLSNDLSDNDSAPSFQVTAAPNASFFRPPADWFAQDAQASKLWKPEIVRVLHYRRHGSLRRREILLLRRLLMHERKE